MANSHNWRGGQIHIAPTVPLSPIFIANSVYRAKASLVTFFIPMYKYIWIYDLCYLYLIFPRCFNMDKTNAAKKSTEHLRMKDKVKLKLHLRANCIFHPHDVTVISPWRRHLLFAGVVRRHFRLALSLFMNSTKLVIRLHFISQKKRSKRCCDTTTPESIHTIDESKRGSAFAFIFGVNWPVQSM